MCSASRCGGGRGPSLSLCFTCRAVRGHLGSSAKPARFQASAPHPNPPCFLGAGAVDVSRPA
eukprot:7376577-Pyramimonas_sp.AAC.1